MKLLVEPLTHDLIGEMQHLLKLHYQELSRKRRPLEPAYWVYLQLQDMGKLVMVTVRNDSNVLVGYHIMVLQSNMHYDSFDALSDVLFLAPEYRDGVTGGRLIVASREAVTDAGADTLVWRAKPGSALDRMLSKRYMVEDNTYIEPLH